MMEAIHTISNKMAMKDEKHEKLLKDMKDFVVTEVEDLKKRSGRNLKSIAKLNTKKIRN